VLLFFVTSADSGALVAATLATGKEEPPIWQRAFWSLLVLAVTATLLISGGLNALQTATIISGVPFAVILLILGWALVKNLRQEPLAHEAGVGDIGPDRQNRRMGPIKPFG